MVVKSPVDPEVEQAYARSHELCQKVGNTPKLVWALNGLWGFALVRGQFEAAQAFGVQLLELADHQQNPETWVVAHRALGLASLFRGEFATAFEHFEQGIELSIAYPSPSSRRWVFDAGLTCSAFNTLALCTLGYPEQARQQCDALLQAVHANGYPYDEAFALCIAAMLHQYRREVDAAQTRADAAVAIADEQGFPMWSAMATMLRGWALAAQGQGSEGVEQIRYGLQAWSKMGAQNGRPHFFLLLAEAYQAIGEPDAGLESLQQAQAAIDATGEHWWAAEVCRLQGELLLMEPVLYPKPHASGCEAETCFRKALEMARCQRAKWWELRAATSLSRWLEAQGQSDEARQVLMETYAWFSEGDELADLQEARLQMERLASGDRV